MAFTQALSNALSGLSAAKRGAEVSSSNIANALTEGYGARELTLRARDVNGNGAGVEIAGMTRRVDPFVLAERRLSDADTGYHKTLAEAHKTIEAAFGEPGSPYGLSARVSSFESSLLRASADPSSEARLEETVSNLATLTSSINQAADRIQSMRERAEQSIDSQVAKLDRSLKHIDRLNDDIVRVGKMGQPTAGLYDQRQQLIDSIADIVPLRQVSRDGGRVALFSTNGETLLDQRPRDISFEPAGTIAAHMTHAGGGLNGLQIDGRPVVGGGPAGLLSGGTLAAAFEVRDNVTVEAQQSLDQFADDLMQRLSDTSIDPTIPINGAGLLTSVGTVGPGPTGLSTALRVNPALDTASKLRDGVGAAVVGPEGDGSKLQGWAKALSDTRQYSAGASPFSAAGFAGAISSLSSSNRVTTEREQSYATAKQEALKQAELADGVDTDEEMQKLMQLEQAYAANAKVIQTIDEMMRHILEI